MKFLIPIFLLLISFSCQKDSEPIYLASDSNNVTFRSQTDIFSEVQSFKNLLYTNSGSLEPNYIKKMVEASINSDYGKMNEITYQQVDVKKTDIKVALNNNQKIEMVWAKYVYDQSLYLFSKHRTEKSAEPLMIFLELKDKTSSEVTFSLSTYVAKSDVRHYACDYSNTERPDWDVHGWGDSQCDHIKESYLDHAFTAIKDNINSNITFNTHFKRPLIVYDLERIKMRDIHWASGNSGGFLRNCQVSEGGNNSECLDNYLDFFTYVNNGPNNDDHIPVYNYINPVTGDNDIVHPADWNYEDKNCLMADEMAFYCNGTKYWTETFKPKSKELILIEDLITRWVGVDGGLADFSYQDGDILYGRTNERAREANTLPDFGEGPSIP